MQYIFIILCESFYLVNIKCKKYLDFDKNDRKQDIISCMQNVINYGIEDFTII